MAACSFTAIHLFSLKSMSNFLQVKVVPLLGLILILSGSIYISDNKVFYCVKIGVMWIKASKHISVSEISYKT